MTTQTSNSESAAATTGAAEDTREATAAIGATATQISSYLGGPARIRTRFTFWLGTLTLVGFAAVAALGLLAVPADDVQGDAVRIIFVHVPSALGAYAAFAVTAAGSLMWLWRRSLWWDTAAHAGAEVGVLLCGLTLITGMLWGRPTWGTYWEWGDVRLVTTLILFLIMVGYLSVRSLGGDSASVATRAAVVGLVGAINIPIVNRSVTWWANRTLHQESSLTDGKLEDLTLFTLVLAFVVGAMAILWMMIHRFRIGWLQRQISDRDLSEALRTRRAEAQQ